MLCLPLSPTEHDASRMSYSAIVDNPAPNVEDIQAAARRIGSHIVKTPVLASPRLSAQIKGSVVLKLESSQRTGSFKIRGALNAILTIPTHHRERGVVTASTGNHGRALAAAARDLGVPCLVGLSVSVPASRADAIRALGANVVIAGDSQDEAVDHLRPIASSKGMAFIHPFDDAAVIAGQGTVGLEMMAQIAELDTVLVPVSGGGLASGIAIAVKGLSPGLDVIGVSSAACPAMFASIKAGRPIQVSEEPSIADNLGGGIGLHNRLTFLIVQSLVQQMLLVDDQEVRQAMRELFAQTRLLVEGAGAASTAGLLQLSGKLDGRRVGVVVSGANMDPLTWATLISSPS